MDTNLRWLTFIAKTLPAMALAITGVAQFGDLMLFEDFRSLIQALGNTYLRAARRESGTHELTREDTIHLLFQLTESFNAALPCDYPFVASVFNIKYEDEDTSRWSMDGAMRSQFRGLHESFLQACVPLSSGIGIKAGNGRAIHKIKNRTVKTLPKLAPETR